MYHGVLATDLIRRDGQIPPNLLGIADDVQIRRRRLHHDDVRALLDIPGDRPPRQAPTPGRELVAFPIAKGRRRARGIPEGPVQAAGELGAVRHEHDLVRDAGFDELQLDGLDPAVVHVRGRNAMRAGLGVRDRDVANTVDGQRIVEAPVFPQDAAVPVGGVLAEADVGDDEEGGEAGAEDADGLDDGAGLVVGCGAQGVFDVRGAGDAEEDHGAETLADEGFEVWDELVDAPAGLAWEGGDQGFLFCGIGDEKGVDEHGLGMNSDQR